MWTAAATVETEKRQTKNSKQQQLAIVSIRQIQSTSIYLSGYL